MGSKVRQQTVAQLRELDAEGRVSARELAKSFAGVDLQRRLFEEDTVSALVHVNVSNLRLERNRRFGDVRIAWKLWQALGLDEWLAVRMPRGRAAVPWDVMAAVLVIARFCAPSSELQIAEDWYRRTALDDLLGLPEEKVNDDRLYRGMVSEANLKWLQERRSRYIVGTPKCQLKRFDAQLLSGKWSQVREGLDVQLAPTESGAETFIVCRSLDRVTKELAIRERFEARMEKGLSRIQTACEKRCYQVVVIERRIGRLLAKNSRATGLYEVTVKTGEKGQAQLAWSKKNNQAEVLQRREGCYVLRSNITEWLAEELWRAYIQVTEAEAAFRIQKDDLQLRPVWHQKTERVKTQILVCFLAYVLRKTLEGWSKRAGLGSSVPTLLEELARIDSTDVTLPTTDGRTQKIRCVVRPDQAQAILLDRLGLELPHRLRPFREIGQTSYQLFGIAHWEIRTYVQSSSVTAEIGLVPIVRNQLILHQP